MAWRVVVVDRGLRPRRRAESGAHGREHLLGLDGLAQRGDDDAELGQVPRALLVVARGEEDDRQLRARSVRAQQPHQLEAVDHGHEQVGDEEIRALALERS